MPRCPSCHDEFREGIATCPDCDQPLVADDAVPGQEPAPPPLHPVLVRVEPPLRDQVYDLLQASRVPCRQAPEGVELPAGLASSVLAGLARQFELEVVDGAPRITAELPQAEPPDGTVLELSSDELARRPEEHLPALRALVEHGAPAQRRVAAMRIVALRRAGHVRLEDLLLEAVREGRRAEVFAWCGELEQERDPDIALALGEALEGLPHDSVLLCLHALSRLPDPRLAPHVVRLLEHEDVEIRAEADEVLCSISGVDFGFEAEADPAERAMAVARWCSWVEERCK